MKEILLILLVIPLFTAAGDDFKKQYDGIAANKLLSDPERLHRLFELDWERGLQESPESATSVGDTRFDDRWTDISQTAIDARKAEAQWPLEVIKSIDRSKLSKADQLNYDLFRRDLELGIEGFKYPGEVLQLSQLGGVLEIDRYIVWPGQALAYKIGQIKIRSLRTYAEHELGDAFDIRAFHDALLENGALPLDILETRMKEWVALEKAKKNESGVHEIRK